MIAWINFIILALATIGTAVFYIKSVGPAALAEKIGPDAYPKCARYRLIAAILMTVTLVNYVIYLFYPLPLGLPLQFGWGWPLSIAMGLIIGLPATYIFFRGMKDAGEETMQPKQEHTLYGGIYQKIRHPQAVGESPLWLVFALLLNSPFLAIFSLVWFPIYYWFCLAEEKDLVLRYGQSYRNYQQQTGFLFPHVRSTEDQGGRA